MICGVVVTTGAACSYDGSVYDGVRVTTAVEVCDDDELDDFPLFLPEEYKSFLCAPAVIVTAINAINNTDFFITVSFCGFFPMQK
jgi:hypothetical protein